MNLRDILLAPSVSKEPLLTLDGQGVHARKLSGLDMASAQAAIPEESKTLEDMMRFSAKLVLLGACDAKGERLFADSDFESVCSMPWDMLKVLIEGIKKHNGMDDAAKNSSTPSTEGS